MHETDGRPLEPPRDRGVVDAGAELSDGDLESVVGGLFSICSA